jgi:hypothetical protein
MITMVMDPINRIGVCRTEVYNTDFIPPITVYIPVMITRPMAPNQKKSMPQIVSIPKTS